MGKKLNIFLFTLMFISIVGFYIKEDVQTLLEIESILIEDESVIKDIILKSEGWKEDESFQKMCENLPDNPGEIEWLLNNGWIFREDKEVYNKITKVPELKEIKYTMPFDTKKDARIIFVGECDTKAALFSNILSCKGIDYKVIITRSYTRAKAHVFLDYEGRQDTKFYNTINEVAIENKYGKKTIISSNNLKETNPEIRQQNDFNEDISIVYMGEERDMWVEIFKVYVFLIVYFLAVLNMEDLKNIIIKLIKKKGVNRNENKME